MRTAILNLLRHRYVKEKQHAMRYRQHAQNMSHFTEFREILWDMAAAEETHAALIREKLVELGEELPEVIPVHFAKEENCWLYLRTDLEEENRCAGESVISGSPVLRAGFPEIADLFERLEREGEQHRSKLREMLARSSSEAVEIA